MMKDEYGRTALHDACENKNVSVDMGSVLVGIGGRELVMMKDDKYGETALHDACSNENVSVDIISALIGVGGRELVMMNKDDGRTALHYACQNENVSADIISVLIDVGGRDLVMETNNDGDTVPLEAIVAASQHLSSIFYNLAKEGLTWGNHMKELTESNTEEIVNGCERSLGLRAFMVAAMGEENDLSSIYGMMRMSPEMI